MFLLRRPEQRDKPGKAAKGRGQAGGRKAKADAQKKGAKKTRARNRKGKATAARPRLLGRIAKWSVIAMIWAGLGLGGLAAWYAVDLPAVGDVAGMTRRPNITMLARDGTQLASFGGVYGESVGLAELPPDLPHAVLAIEDRRFYHHFGVDPIGLLRAIWHNLRAGRVVQGGSTVTQQLAKNLFLSPERTLKRKAQEVMLALWLEHKFSKDQILTIYLNRVYLGGGAYGVDAAARLYFGKPARALTLYESALLAGLLKAPSKLNPSRNAEGAEDRTALVLAAMVQAGFISDKERKTALSRKAKARPRLKGRAPYFADWIMAQLRDYLGGIDTDLKVKTTLDAGLQAIAEQELSASLAQAGKARSVGQAALISLDANGAVRAMVGGRDYGESQFNRATQALRQPGSAFKAFVYLTALERLDLSPESRLLDAPVEISGWRPRNYGDKYYGEVSLRDSFARSLNSVAVRLVQRAGPGQVAATARRLGITSELAANGAIALGASEVTLTELTGAYAAFANGGHGAWPYGIEEIQSSSGEVFYRRGVGGGPGRVVAPRPLDAMVGLMTDVIERGTGKKADPGRPAAGKTGTSQDFRDAWFIGFTGDLVTGVWFGNDDNSPMRRVTGGSLPAAVWGRVMARAFKGLPARPLRETEVAAAEPAPAEEGSFLDRLLGRLTGAPDPDPDREERLQRYFQPREDMR